MRSRSLRSLLVLTLVFVLFAVVGVSQACCGQSPNYYINVSLVGQPICDYRNNTGRVNWTMTYNLPVGHHLHFTPSGDFVNQTSNYYHNLPAMPGTDTLSSHTLWTYEPFHPVQTSYRVYINIDANSGFTNWTDVALISFDCTGRGARNVTVYNG